MNNMNNDKRIPTILLLEEDNDVRELLVESISSRNYHILVAVNKENIGRLVSKFD